MKDFNILDYGARIGDELQTKEIQAALDACFLAGGGRVVIPMGLFRTGGLRLRSNTVLYLESGAILEGSSDPEDYTDYINDTVEPLDVWEPSASVSRSAYRYSRWNNALIRALDAENIAIVGEKGSLLNGVNCFDAIGEENYRGPHIFNAWNCKNIRLEGYAIRDSANWAHAIQQSRDITMRHVTVYAGHDGFDVRTCDNVVVEDCTFITGDDCVAGFDNNDVFIRRCYFDTACSALRFGGNHVVIEDCTAHAPSGFGHRITLTDEEKKNNVMTQKKCRHNMLNVFLYYCDHRADPRRTPGDIVLRRCRFEGADRLFSLEFDGDHIWCCNRSLKSIRFEDCTATGLKIPINIYGDVNEPLTFELDNVTLSAEANASGQPVIDARYYDRISLNNVRLEGWSEPAFVLHSEGCVSVSDSTPVRVVRG